MMTDICENKVIDFLRGYLPPANEKMAALAEECRKEWIPLVQPEVGQFLQVLVRIKGARRILEIGTGIGYSTILLAKSLPQDGHIHTIEIDPERHKRAVRNFQDHNVAGLITPLLGDATEILPTLEGAFDLIFIDAAKGQYPEMFQKIWPLLEPGGVLILDNILLNGWVVNFTWPERRKKTMVVRMRAVLETISTHPLLSTSVIPMGDGIAVCVRRNEDETD